MGTSVTKQLKLPKCSQCMNKAVYYCRTCKQDLCGLCKEEHVIDFDTKPHDVVIDRLMYGDIMMQRICSKCKSKAGYYCRTCKENLCLPCKEEHVIDFDTNYHDVVIPPSKYGNKMLLKTCKKHKNMNLERWCLMCTIPFCSKCKEHIEHNTKNIVSVYKYQQGQYQERISHLKSEIMLYYHLIPKDRKKYCQNKISKLNKTLLIKVGNLKNKIDLEMEDIIENIRKLKCCLYSKHKQLRKHCRFLQKHEHSSEQLANSPIQFLLLFKKISVFKTNNTPSILKVQSFCKEINKANVFDCLGDFQIMETRKRKVRIEQIVKVIYPPVLKKTFRVKPRSIGRLDNHVSHISCLKPGIAWICNYYTFKLIDTNGDILPCLVDSCYNERAQAVTKEGDLVYINRNSIMSKVSIDNKTKYTVMRIKKTRKLLCLYCSPLNGDLLIGMQDSPTAIICRYNSEIQNFQCKQGHGLYVNPIFITENQNGDVIVSDVMNGITGAIVVTNFIGTHRFSYTGNTQASKFQPRGICTDALSHILVCDLYTETVHIIDKDGQFLSVLLAKELGIEKPYSLSYDRKSHLLWVGYFGTSMIRIYKHLTLPKSFIGNFER